MLRVQVDRMQTQLTCANAHERLTIMQDELLDTSAEGWLPAYTREVQFGAEQYSLRIVLLSKLPAVRCRGALHKRLMCLLHIIERL
jgi:hypothetical protein